MISQIMHLPYLAELQELFEIRALCDSSPQVLEHCGRRFGVERMVEVVRSQHRKSAQEIVEALCRAALAYYGMATQKDDITAVAIKMQAG